MDWRTIFSFGSCIIYFAAIVVISTGHPVHSHRNKLHQSLARKTKISKSLPQVKVQKKEKKSSFLSGQGIANLPSTEDAKKKGTIRISGPWHSESGLDRNVDPMEDSYVKKIISSNEGLNFNKDMAEAGEVFDVNGIEDFYDRNALITYEVNGHEVPVHLKQKLTPQSQTMFPEYGHDSQDPTDTSARDGHTYTQRNPNRHKTTTFFGMSLKDMPEYKVQDTPSVNEKQQNFAQFSGRARMGGAHLDQDGTYTRHIFANGNKPDPIDTSVLLPSLRQAEHRQALSQVDRFASEYEQANEVGQEDANMGSRIQNAHRGNFESDFYRAQQPSDSAASKFKIQQHLDGLSDLINRERERFENSDNGRMNKLPMYKGLGDQETHSAESSLFREHKKHPIFPSPSNSEQFYQRRPSDSVQFSDKPKLSLSDGPQANIFKAQGMKAFYSSPGSTESSVQGDSRGVGKDFDGDKLAPVAAEGEKSRADGKNDDSNGFFEQLEKIDEERQKSEQDKQKFLPEMSKSLPELANDIQRYSDDTERTKAKDKLLKILGDLTSKLKGMEAAVKDTHTDERRESPLGIHDTREKTVEPTLEEKLHDESKHESELAQDKPKQESSNDSEATMYNGKNGMDNTHHYPWESNGYSHAESNSHETGNSDTYASHEHRPGDSEEDEANQKHVSHMINNLKENGRPFIFNTEDIDYKGPSYEEKTSSNEGSSQDKDSIRLHGGDRGEHSFERPIMSSFYHSPNHITELDTHAFHPESDQSFDNDVTPTQRDGGRSDQGEKERLKNKEGNESHKKPAESNGDKTAKMKENSSDPDDDLPDYNEVKDAAVFEENFIRKKYHSPSLRWSDDLSDDAQKEADDLADEKPLDLNKKSIPAGMNVALLPLATLNVGKDSADVWKKEVAKFDFVSPIISKKNSNFAQMVWKTAKEFGLGVAKSRDKENWIVVAKYDTPAVSEYEKLKANIESDIPLADPYSDIARRSRVKKARKYIY